jgi:cysteine desulfurase
MIYLDHAASAPLSSEALAAMLPWLAQNRPGNPHARHHAYGMAAHRAARMAREQIAARIGAKTEEIVFTSGATEANNLALQGLAAHLRATGKTHIITSNVEHRSVLEPLRALSGFSISELPVKPCAMIEAASIEKALTAETGLVSVQAVNNETGTIQPLEEIAAMLAGREILFHTDAAQAPGRIDFNVQKINVNFASLSAHKAGGPQGIGALYIKQGKSRILEPLQCGGGQESGLRSGTLPVALCAGSGAAFAAAGNVSAHLQRMREEFLRKISPLNPVIYGHADPAWNAPGIISLRFPGIDTETLTMTLPGLAFGLGSACGSAGNKHSHVIEAITGSIQAAKETIRISFGVESDLGAAADQIIEAIKEIRKIQEAA